jgi:hypothetical protein
MTYARINTITFASEAAADELQANYASTAPAGFPEAQLLVSVRTGPLTASLTSVYEDKAAFDRSAEERTKRMAANGHLIHGVVVEEGEVTLFHTK